MNIKRLSAGWGALRLALTAAAAVLCWLSMFVVLAACSSGPDAIVAVAVDGDTGSGGPDSLASSTTSATTAPEAVPGGDGRGGGGSGDRLYLVNDERGDRALFAVRPDGGDQRRLLGLGGAYPVLSPDGSRIALVVPGSGGGAELFVTDADGTNHKKLADLNDDVPPVWSPDGVRLAFSDYREDEYGVFEVGLFVVYVDGSAGPQQIADITGRQFYEPLFGSWSPDSSSIAFWATDRSLGAHPTKVLVAGADGSDERQLVGADDCQDFAPAWSPDGTRIAYFSYCADGYGGLAISVVDPGGSNPREIAAGIEGWARWPPVWSPDGARLAFYDSRDGTRTIAVVNADGSGLHQLVDCLTIAEYLQAPPVWSPDGARIAFSDSRDGDTEVFVINVDGTNLRQITRNDGHDHVISWMSEANAPAADAMSTDSTPSTATTDPSPTRPTSTTTAADAVSAVETPSTTTTIPCPT